MDQHERFWVKIGHDILYLLAPRQSNDSHWALYVCTVSDQDDISGTKSLGKILCLSLTCKTLCSALGKLFFTTIANNISISNQITKSAKRRPRGAYLCAQSLFFCYES